MLGRQESYLTKGRGWISPTDRWYTSDGYRGYASRARRPASDGKVQNDGKNHNADAANGCQPHVRRPRRVVPFGPSLPTAIIEAMTTIERARSVSD